jgi:hypothetical protein
MRREYIVEDVSIEAANKYFYEGLNEKNIRKKLREFQNVNNLPVNPGQITAILRKVAELRNERFKTIRQETTLLHIDRYQEQIVRLFESIEKVSLLGSCDNSSRKLVVADGLACLDLMKFKEDLVYSHKKGFTLNIVNKLNIDLENGRRLNLEKLTLESKVDFVNLLLKANKMELQFGKKRMQLADGRRALKEDRGKTDERVKDEVE